MIDQKRVEDALKNIVALMSIIQISQKVVSVVASNPNCTEQMLQLALADIASALPSSVAEPPAYSNKWPAIWKRVFASKQASVNCPQRKHRGEK